MEKMANTGLVQSTSVIKKGFQILAFASLLFAMPSCAPHYVAAVPPAPVEVIPVAPYPGAVWIGSSWTWRGGRHVYVPGYYSRPRAGRAYAPGEWRQGPRGHYYVRGGWRR